MAQLMPLSLTISCSSKSRLVLLVLPFWCQLTQVVLDNIQESHKQLCVCVRVLLTYLFHGSILYSHNFVTARRLSC